MEISMALIGSFFNTTKDNLREYPCQLLISITKPYQTLTLNAQIFCKLYHLVFAIPCHIVMFGTTIFSMILGSDPCGN
jgi:hypothetical protein